jgi:signal peptide peptidase SppA
MNIRTELQRLGHLAIQPAGLDRLLAFASPPQFATPDGLVEGIPFARMAASTQALASFQARREQLRATNLGATAVLPLYGFIEQRRSWLMDFFGGTSTQEFGAAVDAAVADPAVSRLVFDVDSPGGSVYGLEELAAKVRAAREVKPIIAVANSLMASAAYYIGSAASKVYAAPGSEIGWVGTLAVHFDESRAIEAAGMTPTIFVSEASPRKAEASGLQPLTDAAREEIQRRVDEYGAAFVADVARNRNVSTAEVRKSYGGGLGFGAVEAVERHMADKVRTLEQTIEGFRQQDEQRKSTRRASASIAQSFLLD